MSTACVGCGQCSNACPNDIPVMELFRTVAQRTQAVFDYARPQDVKKAAPDGIQGKGVRRHCVQRRMAHT
jgi:formate dehydrogenase (coenzyme F420) beta subunit